MDNMIKNAFHNVRMPEECTAKIESNILQNRYTTPRPAKILCRLATSAAACLLLVLTVLCIPGVAQELEKAVDTIAEKLRDSVTESIILYESKSGEVTLILDENENGDIRTDGKFRHFGLPEYLAEESQRLYFVGNGEHIDITDLISYEKPFVYTYQEAQEITHYIAIGGIYDPDSEKCDVGFAAWYYSETLANARGEESGGWVSGYSQYNWKKYEWLKIACEELDIPWRM